MRVLLAPLSDPGFVYPSLAVGRELQRRGHTTALATDARSAAIAAQAGVSAIDFQTDDGTRIFSARRWFQSGKSQFLAVRSAATETSVDVIVTSVLCHGALLAAEALGLPCVVLGLAAHIWPYAAGSVNEDRSAIPRQWLLSEVLRCYAQTRQDVGLRPISQFDQSVLHGDALLLRGIPALECADAILPSSVHHVGACWWEPEGDASFVLARLMRIDKPVVYVHLGRTFGGDSMWPRLNAMFTGAEFQAVVELGRSGVPEPAPGADITVVKLPWMTPLTAISQVVLTNATSAPVLGALRVRSPLIVAPNGSEQTVLAAACIRAGVAVALPVDVDRYTVARLVAAGDARLALARELGDSIATGRSGDRAANIIESVVRKRARIYA